MTAADLARVYQVTPGTIRRWARDSQWESDGWPRKYNPADADKTWRSKHCQPSGIALLAARLDMPHN